MIVLDQDRGMYYNYELDEDEFFNPKDTSAWFFFEIFKNKKFKKPFKKNLFIAGSSYGFGFYLCGIHWITHSLTFDDSFKIFIHVPKLVFC